MMKTILVYCWESTSEPMAIQAMKDGGYQVVEFHGKIKDHHADAVFAQQFMAKLHSEKADMVFSYDYFPLISVICQMNHIPYAAWVYDCPQYMLLSKTISNSCNHIFCFDGAYASRLQQLGAGNIYHFPLACDLDLYPNAKQKKNEDDYACDISFVGSLYNGAGNRLLNTELSEYSEGYIEGLLCAQKEICGYNLIADALPPEVAEEIVEKCNLILGDAYTSDPVRMASDAVNMKLTARDREDVLAALAGHFDVSLYSNSKLTERLENLPRLICKGIVHYWDEMPLVFHNSKINLNISSRTIETGIPQRIFDILASAGFCLTNYQPEIAEMFEDGIELVMYTDTEDMLQKAEYYMSHEEERMRIAQAGYEKVRQHFNIQKRMKELIEKIDTV